MKIKNLFLILLIVAFSSCQTITFYQVYKAESTNKITSTKNFMFYEDDNCKVYYNLWDEGGNIGFKFYNKSDKNIYLNMEECFFILNGISYNYFQNRVFTNTKSSGSIENRSSSLSETIDGVSNLYLIKNNNFSVSKSVGLLNSSSYSVSRNESKIICIPGMTSKIITEYSINLSLFRDCDLYIFPKDKGIKTKTFTKSDSPIVFSNRILYTVGQSTVAIRFENEFYVSEITNYPEYEIIDTKYEEFCGQKSMIQSDFFKISSPDKFYIEYRKGMDNMNH